MKLKSLLILIAAGLCSNAALADFTFANKQGDSLSIDGRFEVRYQNKGNDHQGEWNSGSSRLGFKGVKQLENGWAGFGHAEWGYNSGANGSNIYDRVLYAGVQHEKYGKVSVGTKQWSAFYDVAWFTDLGRTFGSRAFGTYNLNDWGIDSGAGRASNSVVYRNNYQGIKYGFTYQTTREGVKLGNNQTADFDNGLGVSVQYSPAEGYTLGLAYHQNDMSNFSVGTNLSGDQTSRIAMLAANYTGESFYLGTSINQGSNWEVNSQGQFYDSIGYELYTYYHFESGFRATLNLNYLADTDDRSQGYERKTIIPGLEYHFDKNKLVAWAEYQFDLGSDQWDANQYQNSDDQFALGMRYYF
ncbi:MAG: porin [Shewanella sp.]